jgi:hypothetical protein
MESRWHKYHGSAALSKSREILGISVKREIPRIGIREGCQAGDFQILRFRCELGVDPLG